jgi:hypothetical protein
VYSVSFAFFLCYKETTSALHRLAGISVAMGPTTTNDGLNIIWKLTAQNTGIGVAEQNLPVIIESTLGKGPMFIPIKDLDRREQPDSACLNR